MSHYTHPVGANLAPAVQAVKIDDGVYLAGGGRWRIVYVDEHRYAVTDSLGQWNGGRTAIARTLYDARCMVGAARNTVER